MRIFSYVAAASMFVTITQSHAQEYLGLDSYKCAEFLSDSAKPDSPEKLIRSLTMIAWSTGFAAAHQQRKIRSDTQAMRLMAVMAGDACRKHLDKLSVEAVTQTIKEFVNKKSK
jgi:hypothetical protein